MIQVNNMPGAANVRIVNDDRYPFRLLDAWGDVQKAIIDDMFRAGDFTVTATGTSPITQSVLPGAVALITTAATEYAGDNIQMLGAQFKLAAGKPAYFGAKLTVSDATQSDLLVGLCGTDTTLTNASASHAVAVGAGGVFFSKLDGVTQAYAKTVTTATEQNSATAFTLDTDAHVYEFWWDGAFLNAYIDGALVATFKTNVTTEVLTPSLCFRAGEAAAKTCTLHWMRAIQAL
jgi:Glycosyl hydrolases family 16